MNTLIQDGSAKTVTAPTGGYTGGQVVALGTNLCGVVVATTAAGALATVNLTGVYSTAVKKAGASLDWTRGENIYLTATGDLTTVSTSNTYAGVAWEVATTGATTGEFLLNK